MKPKEKAFELAHKFRLLEIRTSENSHMMISMADAKQCALIAVEMILETLDKNLDSSQFAVMNYWNDIKEEIQKF